MVNFTATSSVTVYDSIEAAVAGLETKLEAVVNTGVIRSSSIERTKDNRWVAYIVWTAAV